MSLFHNKEYEAIQKLRDQVKEKRDEAVGQLQKISNELTALYEDVAMGKAKPEDVQKLEAAQREARAQLQEVDEKLERVEGIRKRKAFETLPLVKQWRRARTNKLQAEYDEKLRDHYKLRNQFLQSLAELGRIQKEADTFNREYNNAMQELGGKDDPYGKHVKNKPVITNGWNPEKICIGIREDTQTAAGYSGILPDWAKADENNKKEGDK